MIEFVDYFATINRTYCLLGSCLTWLCSLFLLSSNSLFLVPIRSSAGACLFFSRNINPRLQTFLIEQRPKVQPLHLLRPVYDPFHWLRTKKVHRGKKEIRSVLATIIDCSSKSTRRAFKSVHKEKWWWERSKSVTCKSHLLCL